MTVTIERRAHGTWVSCATKAAGHVGSAAALATLLARALPYNLRWAIRDQALIVTAALPPLPDLEAGRLPWLAAEVERAATAPTPPAALAPDDGDTGTASHAAEGLEMLDWIASYKGWQTVGPGCFAIPGESDYPPVTVTGAATAIRITRSVPLLPGRHVPAMVRLATLHAALRLNAAILFARLALIDETALTFAVESHVPLAGCDEDELESALEGVRYGARSAAGALACLRHQPVAAEYAAAHDLPVPAAAPEAHKEA